jgi:twitching motility two-component system response regulator PilH
MALAAGASTPAAKEQLAKDLYICFQLIYTGIARRVARKETRMAVNPRVLIIDDDQDFRVSVRSLLESHGHEVIEAESGHEGLRKVVEHKPDIILLDIMMESSVEGYGITQSLRYQDEYAPYRHIPIVMVSSIQESPDERFPMCPEVEMIRPEFYLTKPIEIGKLLEMIKTITVSAHV